MSCCVQRALGSGLVGAARSQPRDPRSLLQRSECAQYRPCLPPLAVPAGGIQALEQHRATITTSGAPPARMSVCGHRDARPIGAARQVVSSGQRPARFGWIPAAWAGKPSNVASGSRTATTLCRPECPLPHFDRQKPPVRSRPSAERTSAFLASSAGRTAAKPPKAVHLRDPEPTALG
jgi:hypothetical protein